MNSGLTQKEIESHDEAYNEAWELIKDEIQLQGPPPLNKPGWLTRRKLKQAISLFEQTLKINPANWSSMWALGKIHQRLDEYSTAMDWLLKAHELEPSNPDILREGALCAMKIGEGTIAVQMAVSAVKLKPGDAGLLSNLALALLIDNRIDEARQTAKEAVQAHPEGRIANAVEQLIDDVHAGKRPCPKTLP